MRVVEHAEAIGIQFSHPLQREGEAFRRLFRQAYNAAPIDYLLDLRVRRADDLLMSGRCTVAEAAEQTGFRDESYFCRCFRQRMGVSPGRRMAADAPVLSEP